MKNGKLILILFFFFQRYAVSLYVCMAVNCHRMLKPRLGEVIIDKISHVEDTKGNNGVNGN